MGPHQSFDDESAFAELTRPFDPAAVHAPFDEHGLPTGPAGAQVWSRVLFALEAELEAGGWDAPTRLFAIAGPAHAHMLGVDVDELAAAAAARAAGDGPAAPIGGTPYALLELDAFTEHPVDRLWGRSAPDWAAAIVLAFEGWHVAPTLDADGNLVPIDEAVRPSEHPDRREMRIVQMLTRSGQVYAVRRDRGEEPLAWGDEDGDGFTGGPGGFVIDVLTRVLGLPVEPDGHIVADFLGRLVLGRTLRFVQALTDPQGDSLQEVPVHLRAGADQASAAFRDMSADVREELVRHLTLRAALQSVAHVTWLVSGKAKQDVPRSDGRLLYAVGHAKQLQLSEDDLTRLMRAARIVSDLDWTTLVRRRQAAPLLPAPARQVDWAGPDLVARLVCERYTTEQATLLRELEEATSAQTTGLVESLLVSAGWSATAAEKIGDLSPWADGGIGDD